MNESSFKVSFSDTDEKFLGLITKYLLLIIMVNISTLLVIVYWALEISFGLPFFAQTFLSFDNLINLLSLFLQFALEINCIKIFVVFVINVQN